MNLRERERELRKFLGKGSQSLLLLLLVFGISCNLSSAEIATASRREQSEEDYDLWACLGSAWFSLLQFGSLHINLNIIMIIFIVKAALHVVCVCVCCCHMLPWANNPCPSSAHPWPSEWISY